jgi:hypothetical protein
LVQWLGCRPDNSFAFGTLCDFDDDGHPYPHGLGGAADAACGFLWRPYLQENVSVGIQAYLRENAPSNIPSSPLLSCIGVLARVTGGVLTSDFTSGVHYANVTGYGFLLEGNEPQSSATFSLVRWNAGLRTNLITFPYSLALIPTDFEQPVGLKLTVTTVAGNAVLSGTISNVTVNGVVFQNFNLFPPITDSTADKITGTGRGGILLGQDRVLNFGPEFPIRLREKVTSWTVTNPANDTVLVRDEFLRLNKGASFLDTSDFGTTGRSLQSAFYHDLQSAAGQTQGKITRDTSPADAIQFTAAGLGDSTFVNSEWAALSQRPANNTRTQTPKIVVQWESSGTDGLSHFRHAGLIVRGSAPTPSSNGTTTTGYVAYIGRTIGGGVAKLWRYLNGAKIELAAASFTVNEATDYTVELAVRDQPGTGLGGPAELELLVDSVRVNLVATTNVDGVFNPSSGIVVDGTANRITQGPGEGIYVFSNDTTKTISVTTWDEGIVVPSVTPWEDYASYPVLTEGTASGSLNTVARVVYPFAPAAVHVTDTTISDAGYRYTQARISRGYRLYDRLQTEPMGQAAFDALLAFWHSKEGGKAFSFTDPVDGLTRKVRFAPESWQVFEPFRGVYYVEFGLEELA